jgi:hypothetical protein
VIHQRLRSIEHLPGGSSSISGMAGMWKAIPGGQRRVMAREAPPRFHTSRSSSGPPRRCSDLRLVPRRADKRGDSLFSPSLVVPGDKGQKNLEISLAHCVADAVRHTERCMNMIAGSNDNDIAVDLHLALTFDDVIVLVERT